MITEIENLIKRYPAWLLENTDLTNLKSGDGENFVQITTPFLDRHNDFIQIYAERNGKEGFVLTDDGYTISDLEMSGFSFDSQKRKDILNIVLMGYGVRLQKNELCINASANDFPEKKHMLIQTILAVNDLFYLAQPYIKSFFYEDVNLWLSGEKIRFTRNIKITGQSGFLQAFEFVIPHSEKCKERLIKTLNNPDRTNISATLFAFNDVKYREKDRDFQAIAFINDINITKDAAINSFENYKVTPILWSERESAKELLSA